MTGTPRVPGGGRKPKPAWMKFVQGTGTRPNEDAEFVTGLKPGCDKPDWLPASAAMVWDRVAPACTQMGTLHELNGDLLAAYCIFAGRQREGRYLKKSEATEMRHLAMMFGLCPIGRQKLDVTRSKPDRNAERDGAGLIRLR
jgi:phage terminase small subunit